MDHLCTIRSRPHLFANIRTSGLICRNGPSPFAVVRRGRLCKQGVVGSSPIVSTADQGKRFRSTCRASPIEHLSNIDFRPSVDEVQARALMRPFSSSLCRSP